MDDQLVAVPAESYRVRLDRVVVVARRAVAAVNDVRRVGERRFGVADGNLDRLADEALGRARMGLGLLEGPWLSGLVRGALRNVITSATPAAASAALVASVAMRPRATELYCSAA